MQLHISIFSLFVKYVYHLKLIKIEHSMTEHKSLKKTCLLFQSYPTFTLFCLRNDSKVQFWNEVFIVFFLEEGS